eukprot:COSAG02_NODE_808_length_16924_cov_117.299733_12_plen_63_part_00
MIYDLHDARRPVVKGRLRRRAAMVRLGGREAMYIATSSAGDTNALGRQGAGVGGQQMSQAEG